MAVAMMPDAVPDAGPRTCAFAADEFEKLVLPQLDGLFRLAVHLTRNVHDAEDLVQETCLRAYRFFDHFQPGSNFKAWIFRILRNHFINQYHSRKARDCHVDVDSIVPQLKAPPEEAELEARIDSKAQRLETALGHLPHEWRLTFLLVYWEGLTYAEAGRVLNCPIGTVMSRLFRSRRRLQHDLRVHERMTTIPSRR